jgi:hypothetical protein
MGNYSDYEADRKRRLGAAADQPHRIKYRQLSRSRFLCHWRQKKTYPALPGIGDKDNPSRKAGVGAIHESPLRTGMIAIRYPIGHRIFFEIDRANERAAFNPSSVLS